MTTLAVICLIVAANVVLALCVTRAPR